MPVVVLYLKTRALTASIYIDLYRSMALVCSTSASASALHGLDSAWRLATARRAVATARGLVDASGTRTNNIRLRLRCSCHAQIFTHTSQARRNVSCAVSLKWTATSSDGPEIDDLEEAKSKALRLLSSRTISSPEAVKSLTFGTLVVGVLPRLYTRHALERRLLAQKLTVKLATLSHLQGYSMESIHLALADIQVPPPLRPLEDCLSCAHRPRLRGVR
eukprot:5500622-Pyramimonas_sp.AAC.1